MVAVSVAPQSYFVKRIAGERVSVVTLLPPGASPATYEPTLSSLTALARARLWFRVGVDTFAFEAAWTERVRSAAPHMRLVNTSVGVGLLEHNPHLWLSPRRAVRQAEQMAKALSEVDPAGAKDYAAGLKAFRSEVAALDAELSAALAPAKGRTVLVFHPSWDYLTADYGLRMLAIEDCGHEPGPGHAAEVLGEARRLGIDTVFVQPQMHSRSAHGTAEALGGKVRTLDPLDPDWPHALRAAAQAFAGAAR